MKTSPLALACGCLSMTLTLAATATAGAATCDGMSALSLPNTTITMAQTVAAGSFTAPARGGAQPGGGRGQQFGDLPEFCRVLATLTPSSDSEIKIELWMPAAASWN